MSNTRSADADKIKMLIVDDEPIICEGLRYTIDWDSLGIHVVGEAYDGEEALRKVESEEVDLLLTDIRMDGMDGLKLTEQLNEKFPGVHVIVISGYENFEYARQALRMNVDDYLLKPVEIDELIGTVSRVLERIRDEKGSSSEKEDELWLSNCIHNSLSYVKESPPAFLAGKPYRILTTQIAEFNDWQAELSALQYENIQQQWINHVQSCLKSFAIRSISVFDHPNLLYTLAVSNEELSAAKWNQALEEMLRSWQGEHSLYCGVSEISEHSETTGLACKEAEEILRYHVLEDVALLLPEYRDPMDSSRVLPNYNHAKSVQLLVPLLFKQDLSELKSLNEIMFTYYRENRFLLNEIIAGCDELFTLLRQRLRQSGIMDVEHGRWDPPDLNSYNSYELVEAVVMAEMEQLFRLIDKNGVDRSYWIIEKVKKYLADQYRNDLKAFEVAAWLKITPSYFSYIFKQGTGKSFSEYMNELRIEHAKQLLTTTQDKVFEIAEQVGYKEYKYFVTVFKTYTGMTPKDYRMLKANH
ncbi:response regulator transcription factor [Cohnella herbarum]|uniref:response regulator transcription factor n=1 Tax=Cohnella herbarum TaxID=2728023 RepID=UPI0020C43322|nr:response regulator [Cohnella herbarum]